MRTIWKFKIREQRCSIPRGAEILCVQMQNGQACLWAEVDPAENTEERKFYIVGTGHELPSDRGVYLGTIQEPPFVWHIYEMQESK